MAAVAGNQESRRMNLCALKQRDPYITGIVDTASQVALYLFNSKTSEWEKTDVEGTLFVYSRLDHPSNGFMILNRLGLNDLVEPINRSLEFQLQDPFLLYRNDKGGIYGVWFYDQDECARIGQLMNSLVQVATSSEQSEPTGEQRDNSGYRQRRASESDSQLERTCATKTVHPPTALQGSQQGAAQGTMQSPAKGGTQHMNVDILQILCRAQDEYDKTKCGGKKSEPKPMIDNPNAAAMKTSSLPKPLAVKMRPDSQGNAPLSADSANVHTQISLDALFRRASQHHEAARSAQPDPPMPAPLLHRLMSSPAHLSDLSTAGPAGQHTSAVVTELGHAITPLHLGPLTCGEGRMMSDKLSETERDLMPKPAGAEAPGSCANGSVVCQHQGAAAAVHRPQTNTQHAVSCTQASTSSVLDCSAAETQQSDMVAISPALSLLSPSKIPCRNVNNAGVAPAERIATDKPQTPVLLADRQVTAVTATGCTLVTPQQLCQSSKIISSQLSNASVLLSPMMFQTVNQKDSSKSSSTGSASTNVFYQNRVPSSSGQLATDTKLSTTQPSTSVLPHRQDSASSQPPGVSCQQQSGQLSSHPSTANLSSQAGVDVLTRQQMQQAIVYLIQNDPSFVATLHDAYLKSIQTEQTSDKS